MTRALLAATALLLALAAPAGGSARQEALFQDDDRLIYPDSDAEVERTLDELRALGVDRLRITLAWRAIAPAAESDARPAVDLADPAAYGDAAWRKYDRIVRLARERGIGVNFDLTAPAPDWATGTPEREDIDDVYTPDPQEFGRFVRAVATRYADVDNWSVWNEPNQAAWLSPQWVRVDGRWEEASPRLYRELLDAAWEALQATGHGDDTILIGETAPKGLRDNRGETRSIDAFRFLRRLYCVDDTLQVLRGREATAQGCPTENQLDAFPAQHPALFRATGYAHHPYELLFAPDTPPSWEDWATLGNLDELQLYLRRFSLRYRQGDRSLPLYLTEFGYQTNPPDRFGVSWREQADFLAHAEFIAYRNPGVRALAQFLLVDGGEPVSRTFQTGLRTDGGRAKPSLRGYRFPIHVAPGRRGRVRVFGLARPAAGDARPRYAIEVRRGGRWRRVATRRGRAGAGYLDARLRVRGERIRLRWERLTSRAVAVPARR